MVASKLRRKDIRCK
ncbi:hypothetical protein KIPB_017315, partial [Kipferlia bialata]|eukprot:g17315.t1